MASDEKLIVLDTAASVCFCQAACMRTCHSGSMSRAERKTVRTESGSATGQPAMVPWSQAYSTTSSMVSASKPAPRSASRNTGLVSYMIWALPALSFMTWRLKARLKMGSMPPEQPAMIEMVPVGAMVTQCALRILRPSTLSQREPFQCLKVPFSSASRVSSSQASCRMKAPTSAARSRAAWLS